LNDPLIEGLVIAPLILIGVFLMQYRKTVAAATDATLIFMFVEQPGVVVTAPAPIQLEGAMATVIGIGIAWASFRYLLPIDPTIRFRSILTAIVGDLEIMAASTSATVLERLRARLQHRVIRLVVLAKKSDADHLAVVEGALSTLAIGKCLLHLHEAHKHEDIPPATAQIIRQTLQTVAHSLQQPDDVIPVLQETSRVLHALGPKDESYESPARLAAETMGDAAALFRGNVVLGKGRTSQCPG